MTPAQPIFHAFGLLAETLQGEEEAPWSHRCSALVEAPGHKDVGKGGMCGKELQMFGRMIKLDWSGA